MNVAKGAAKNEVGVRELKDHLSRYLAQANAGAEIVVTDHGRPIARLMPIDERARMLQELVARGEITPGPEVGYRGPFPPPIKTKGTVSDLIER
jgi:prevent-host-death family protein